MGLIPSTTGRYTVFVEPLIFILVRSKSEGTARQYRDNKASMEIHIPPILQRLNISQRNWLEACTQLELRRSTAVGCQESVEQAKLNLNKRRIHLLRLDS